MRRKDKVRKVIRAFGQAGLKGLVALVDFIESNRRQGVRIGEMGSSSIIDPQAHVARIKKAMGIAPSVMDAVWASLGDTDASLYMGFAPGRPQLHMDPIDWLNLLADSMHRVPRESMLFVDRLFGFMTQLSQQPRQNLAHFEK